MKYIIVLLLASLVCATASRKSELKAKSPGCDPAIHDCSSASRTV